MWDADQAGEVLALDRQSFWASLRLRISQRSHYLLQLVPPSLTQSVAAELDNSLWKLYKTMVGFPVPKAGGKMGASSSMCQRSQLCMAALTRNF